MALRDVVRRTVPQAEETLLWGGLLSTEFDCPTLGGCCRAIGFQNGSFPSKPLRTLSNRNSRI